MDGAIRRFERGGTVILLTKNDNAQDHYKDDYLEARFHLIKIWELDAAKYLEAGLEVQPFIPLMKGGLTHVLDAERKIYNENGISQAEKGDLLTALTVFMGLKDKSLMQELINRRRDIMIESPAIEIFKEEGRLEGRLEGMEKGKLEDARKMKSKGFDLSDIMDITGLSRETLAKGGVVD